MEALFDFTITLIKVYLISYLYVKIYCFLTEKIETLKLLPKIRKKQDFKFARIIISIALMVYSFTYWGNKGYGDESLIPIGGNKHIVQTNGNQASISPKEYKYGTLNIDKFQIENNLIYGEAVNSPVNSPPPFFVWYHKTEKIIFFNDLSELKYFLKTQTNLNIDLKPFSSNYINYWNIRMILMA